MLTSFTTKSNRLIFIEAIYCQRTYLGEEVGEPDREMSSDVIQTIRQRVARFWPTTPIAIVGDTGLEVLPKYCIAAMANSPQPVHELDKDGSELVLVWFTDQPPYGPKLPVTEALQECPWDSHARDFIW
jgi:hypothetical protein